MFQTIIVAGYLGRDPELRYTGDGTPVANFSLATSRRWSGQDGSPREQTTWFRVTVWRRQAEICNQYLQKGRAVLVEGELNSDPDTGGPRLWTGNDGATRASYEITARTVRFLGGRGDVAPAGEPGGTLSELPSDDDEIPF
jgi:single-strand DNA-binding protein